MNLFDANMAYAGQHETTSLGIRHRQQWHGIDGGPVSSYLSAHRPFASNRMGWGARILNEQIGARQQTLVALGCAYRLRLKSASLNFGLGLGFGRMEINWDKLQVMDQGDTQVEQWQSANWAPALYGSVFYSRKNLYAGLEASQWSRSYYSGAAYQQKVHMKAVYGYHLKVGRDDQLQLAAMTKWAESGQWQQEWNLVYLKNNKIGLGAGYRLYYGAIVLAQFHFSQQMRIGFNYDFATAPTQQAYDGSFEFFLGYTLKQNAGKSIRYL
jgi:type IX secretion system PorP/SprF family membrane protein